MMWRLLSPHPGCGRVWQLYDDGVYVGQVRDACAAYIVRWDWPRRVECDRPLLGLDTEERELILKGLVEAEYRRDSRGVGR